MSTVSTRTANRGTQAPSQPIKPHRDPARARATARPATKDLPLAAVRLGCGHTAREYGLQVGDWLWCDPCGDRCRVAQVLAA